MNKRWWMAGGAFGIGAAMLLASGLSAMASTSGYDTYEAAMKRTAAVASLTANASLTVTDNGKSLLTAASDIRWDQASHAGSIAAKADGAGEAHAANVYFQDGKLIVKTADSDVYRVKAMEEAADKAQPEKPHAPPKAVLQLFDALTGNVKELATTESTTDGGKLASLHLSGSRIPAVVNALGALAVSGKGGADDAKLQLPELTDAVKVERIDLDAKIAPDGMLDDQTAIVVVSGMDDSGAKHELQIQLRIDFEGYNETTPAHVDLTGKKVEALEEKDAGRGPWHR